MGVALDAVNGEGRALAGVSSRNLHEAYEHELRRYESGGLSGQAELDSINRIQAIADELALRGEVAGEYDALSQLGPWEKVGLAVVGLGLVWLGYDYLND